MPAVQAASHHHHESKAREEYEKHESCKLVLWDRSTKTVRQRRPGLDTHTAQNDENLSLQNQNNRLN